MSVGIRLAVNLLRVKEHTDDTLLERARNGDREAFDDLIRRYADRLYSLVASLVGPGHDAEEVVQETFLRAWKSIGRFKGESQFFTWLYRIGVNESNRRGEQITRRNSRSAFSLDDESGREFAAESEDPDRISHLLQVREGLIEAVAELPVDQRQAIVLRDINGFSTVESAAIMEVGDAAFKSKLHRARLRVRAVVAPLLEVEP